MAQTYLTKTFGSSGNLDVWTVSFWVKKSLIETGNDQYIMHSQTNGDNQTGIVLRGSGDNYQLQCFNAVSASANNGFNVYTSMYFRDPSAWYHIIVACDTTEASGNNGLKMYVNGTQVSTTVGAWNQNADTQFSKNQQHVVGAKTGNSLGFGGYLSQFIFANGTQYAASTFGSTNANGIWVPNTGPSVTYGTNGFKLNFAGTGVSADASGFGADSSGNNNHFASSNLGTNPSTADTCQNNFATFNPLDTRAGGVTFSLGSMKVVTSGSNRNYVTLTQAFASGKWYMECRFTAGASSGYVGFCDMSNLQMTGTSTLGDLPNEARVNNDGSYEKNNSTTSGWAGSFTDNDILGLALDCDNNRFTLSKNGQWADGSGNYDEANPTAYITYTTGNFMSFAFGEGAGGATATIEINTGNAPYTISSGNADGAGYGSFEYAVPSGYYALCTKNLAAYGG